MALAARVPPGSVLHRRAPDLPAGLDIDREGPLAVDGVDDAVVDRRRRELAQVVHQARAPHRHQPLDVRFVDLLERAVALAVETHALGQHVVRVLAVIVELFGRLRHARAGDSASTAASSQVFRMVVLPVWALAHSGFGRTVCPIAGAGKWNFRARQLPGAGIPWPTPAKKRDIRIHGSGNLSRCDISAGRL